MLLPVWAPGTDAMRWTLQSVDDNTPDTSIYNLSPSGGEVVVTDPLLPFIQPTTTVSCQVLLHHTTH